MTAARPQRASLKDRFAPNGAALLAPAPALAPAGEGAPEPTAPAPQKREPEGEGDSKDSRVQVLVRMTPLERKKLRQIALDQDTTVQALCEDTLRDLIRRHGG
jgi:hypothetical protein